MPELPEVETVVRELRACLTGARFAQPRPIHPQVLEKGARRLLPRLAGASVVGVARRGKLILIDLEGDLVLTLHLRMTGRLRVVPASAPLEAHTHARLPLHDGREVRFSDMRRFGRIGLYHRQDLDAIPFLRGLGPEPCDLTAAQLRERLARRTGPVKGALLDQTLIAGLGNIYVDELLFEARIHPRQPGCSLSLAEVQRVVTAMRRVLAAAIRDGGSSIRDFRPVTQRSGRYQHRHRVFRKQGRPCPRCGTAIVKLRVAGRGTHVCRSCQPLRRTRHTAGHTERRAAVALPARSPAAGRRPAPRSQEGTA
jgi:formamidopyrimidine-DNA glycosylase